MFKRITVNNAGRADAQALVEFALALPVVLLLIFGVLEIGRAFQVKIVMENAAREGAHYFIYNNDDATNNFTDTKAAVQTESANSGVMIETGDIIVQCLSGGSVDNTCPVSSTVEVIVENDFEVSVFSYFLGPIQMHSSARMLVP